MARAVRNAAYVTSAAAGGVCAGPDPASVYRFRNPGMVTGRDPLALQTRVWPIPYVLLWFPVLPVSGCVRE